MTSEVHNPLVAQAAAAACWSCHAPLETVAHFCAACGRIQPPADVDHFAFFTLPRRLNLDAPALETEFYRLSRKLHPDLYARASQEEQAWSLERTSQLNDAYRALKEPVARTRYLLSLEGVHLEEQSSAATAAARASGAEKKQTVPPELLEEVFELNLQLQDLRAAKATGGSDPETQAALVAARDRFQSMLEAGMDELRRLWSRWDSALTTEARLTARDTLVAWVNRHNYVRNLVRDVNEALS